MLQLPRFWLLLLVFVCSFGHLSAQQWVQKSYAYDSTYSVVYGTAIHFAGGVDTLKMDIYTPLCDGSVPGAKRPLAVFVHGGAFVAGNKSDMTHWCKEFAKRGYVTATVSYRLGMISDENAWGCAYPNYNCIFATDTAEWYRSAFRAMQDVKGAIRYFVNRQDAYQIDVNNIFVAGESAGAFAALGAALMDTITEKPTQAFALGDVPKPNANTGDCSYNLNKSFSNMVARPDLGSFEGNIEPTTIPYTIKAIGNIYGGMIWNTMPQHKAGVEIPDIYSFHQPCDIIVPMGYGKIMEGLSWCFTNGYNCYGVANTPQVMGSKAFSDLNTQIGYGYAIQNEFTSKQFPYSFVFGEGSCLDQLNNPCHALDNFTLRENNLAAFFANRVNISTVCQPQSIHTDEIAVNNDIKIYPNPCSAHLWTDYKGDTEAYFQVSDILGRVIASGVLKQGVNEIVLGSRMHTENLVFSLKTDHATFSKTIQYIQQQP